MQSKNISQHVAASPDHSVWVSASAGTGKTKVLTDRVLRLLLSGVAFDKILCLTFTNAAAAEMNHRITKSLMEWQSNPESVEIILGRNPTKLELKTAKNLLQSLMLSPEQLSIHTIHSFCQKTLQKFPFEAGVEAGFKVLNDIEARELCERLIDDIASSLSSSSYEDPSTHNNKIGSRVKPENDGLRKSWNHVLSNTHESTFSDIIFEILTNQIAFRDLFHQFPTTAEYANHLREEAKTKYDDDFYLSEFISNNNSPINISGKNLTDSEIDLIKKYNLFTTLPLESQIKQFSKIKLLFCTTKGEPRKNLLYKKSREQYPNLHECLNNIQMQIFDTDQKIKIARMIKSTCHMFEIAKYVIGKYTEHKKRLVCLDYDDLIYYTKELLTNNAVKDWVLYKLDGGIMHLLVDEAQDTSPKQWQIIEAIMSEFYSGESATKEDRTIFIVGDEKQSIYSFQGADVRNFARVNHFIKDQMVKAKKQYKDIELELAYRSTLPILQFVKEIFGSKYFPKSNIECFRIKDPGLVELWPLYKEENSMSELFWPLVHELQLEQPASSILAADIAKFIRNYIDSGAILPSTGKAARPEDFMILIRRRNQFTHEIISKLKEQEVFVAGIDRMMIMQHLSVQDIVAIAKFVLLPEDNLNLAALLRSPIIGVDDLTLHKLSTTPRINSLYSCIKDENLLQQLNSFISMSSLGAFNFLHYIIDIMGYREVLNRANGEGSNDVLDELLSLASNWGNKNNDNLQEFIYWLEKREIEIKRDVSSSSSVRIMTVHAAKGLEAPVVILADTTSMPKGQSNFLWKNGYFLWLGSSHNKNILYENYKNEIESMDYEEYLRLLYVAMTRAEDHLVIAGFTTKEEENENSWYGLASRAMDRIAFKEKDGIKKFGEYNAYSSSTPQEHTKLALSKSQTYIHDPNKSVLNWHPKVEEIDNNFSYVKSPLASRMDISYGSIIHKILEDSVKTRNFTFKPSHPYIQALPSKMKEPVITKLSQLFTMEKFIALTKYPTIKTEVSIGYMENDTIKIGRIDFVAISSEEVIIVDYKTDSNPPTSSNEVNDKYKAQLKFYSDSMKKIMPNHNVRAKILWLENLEFMDIIINLP